MTRYMTCGLSAAAFTIGLAFGGTAHAASCNAGKAGEDLSLGEAAAIYDCLKDKMVKGYQKGGKRWIPAEYVNGYRD